MILRGLLAALIFTASAAAEVGVFTPSLLHPRFPIKDLIDIKPKAVTVLYKSFGSRWSNLHEIAPYVNTIVVYVDCGPCRHPRRPKGQFSLIAPRLSIDALNRSLEVGHENSILAFERAAEDIARNLPRRDGLRYIIMPALEDTYTPGAAAQVREILKRFFPWDEVGRNPLVFRQARYPVEIHSYSASDISKLKPGDVINGDGVPSCLSTTCNDSQFRDLRNWSTTASKSGVLALIYVPQIQGLPAQIRANQKSFTPPKNRVYSIPNKNLIKRLIHE